MWEIEEEAGTLFWKPINPLLSVMAWLKYRNERQNSRNLSVYRIEASYRSLFLNTDNFSDKAELA